MHSYRTLGLALLAVAAAVVPASAQMDGRIGVGVAVTRFQPRDGDLEPRTGITASVRLNPQAGLGIAAGLNWLDLDVDGSGGRGRLRTRPLMLGIGYTVPTGRLMTTVSVVGGPSWNSLRLDGAAKEDSVSVAVRPGVGVTYAVAPRFGITGFGGYMFNRPSFEVETPSGRVDRTWKADGLALSAGVVVTLF